MPPRHSLAWLSARGWQRALQASAAIDQPPLRRWQHAAWPVVVRRREPDLPATILCLGVPLPPDAATGNKHRIGLRADTTDIERITPPLMLGEALALFDTPWADGLASLQAEASQRGLALRLYGSCAMQALTGLPYLSATSDIDLLFYPRSQSELQAGMALLTSACATLPLDGEIVFPSGHAVAWKEWHDVTTHGTSRILVKQNDRVALSTVAALCETFAASATL